MPANLYVAAAVWHVHVHAWVPSCAPGAGASLQPCKAHDVMGMVVCIRQPASSCGLSIDRSALLVAAHDTALVTSDQVWMRGVHVWGGVAPPLRALPLTKIGSHAGHGRMCRQRNHYQQQHGMFSCPRFGRCCPGTCRCGVLTATCITVDSCKQHPSMTVFHCRRVPLGTGRRGGPINGYLFLGQSPGGQVCTSL
jgi:hypothetical protein